jgi:hypothetical protein
MANIVVLTDAEHTARGMFDLTPTKRQLIVLPG